MNEDYLLEVVWLPTSEVETCRWPRPSDAYQTSARFTCECPQYKRLFSHLFRESIYLPHYRCSECGALVLVSSAIIEEGSGRLQPAEVPLNVARPDGWYGAETALYRYAAATNSTHGRIRARIDRYREDIPGPDWSGQRRRRGA